MFIIALFLCASQASAVGFGEVRLKSHLGEPLNMSVPLVFGKSELSEKINVELASGTDYKMFEQMVPKSYHLLRVDLEKNTPQQWDVLLSSSQAIDESFLVIVLKVQRGNGNFFKKIQLFLDPENIKPQVSLARGNVPASVNMIDSEFPEKAGQIGQVSSNNLSGFANGWSRRNRYGPVQSGDSLSVIAYRLRKDKRWSNQAIMLALYNENKEAFANYNINHLKKGSFLDVPDDAEVKAFVGSTEFTALKSKLLTMSKAPVKPTLKKVKKAEEKKAITPNEGVHGRISLGMTESLDSRITDEIILSRLEKLEPLYQKVISTDLHMDSIGNKIDKLEGEVRSLHEKVDALSAAGLAQGKSESNFGWIWFVVLLLINVLVLLFYFYRKKMVNWQEKLDKYQVRKTFDEPKETSGDAVMAPALQGNTHQDKKETLIVETKKTDAKRPVPSTNTPVVENVKKVDFKLAFEDAVLKRHWLSAQECYDKMSLSDKDNPRVQAMYIKMLHNEDRLIDRNSALLKISKRFTNEQWNNFCSFLDEAIWVLLQEENIINFMGDVSETEVERANLELADREDRPKNIMDLSDTDLSDVTMDDFNLLNDEVPQLDDIDLLEETSESNDSEQDESLSSLEGFIDKTVVMNANDLQKWGHVDSSKEEVEPLEVDFDLGNSVSELEIEEHQPLDIKLDFDFDSPDSDLSEEPKEGNTKD